MRIKFARTITDGSAWDWPPSNHGPHRPSTIKGRAMFGHDVDEFRERGAKVYASNWYSDQAANDNQDWPLAKLLRTEKNDACLALAHRYRDLHDTATMPVELVGREAVDLYIVHNQDDEGKSRGLKVITGKTANMDTPARRGVTAGETTKKASAPVPKRWNGDWPILAAIDARRELAIIRAKLAYVPKILDAFEWSVVDSLTLEEIGHRLGAGSKGAKGEARARVFDGFGIVDRHWQHQRRAAA